LRFAHINAILSNAETLPKFVGKVNFGKLPPVTSSR